jgi:hypothetical protein
MSDSSCWPRSSALRDTVAPSGQPVRVRRGPSSWAGRAGAVERRPTAPRHGPAGHGLTWAGLAPADRASFGWRLPSFEPIEHPTFSPNLSAGRSHLAGCARVAPDQAALEPHPICVVSDQAALAQRFCFFISAPAVTALGEIRSASAERIAVELAVECFHAGELPIGEWEGCAAEGVVATLVHSSR